MGGIEGLMYSVLLSLKDDYDVVLLGPRGSREYAAGAVRVYELPVNIIGYLTAAFFLIPFLLFQFRPALIMGSNGLMSPLVAIMSKLSRGSSVCFLHGLDILVKNRVYSFILSRSAKNIDTFIVNSTNTKDLALKVGLPVGTIELIHPCIRNPVASPVLNMSFGWVSNDETVIIYAGRIVPRKGLLEFIQECGPWLRREKYRLIVSGDEPFGQAGATTGSYVRRLQQAVAALELDDSIEFLGRVSDTEMAAAFARATVHVMPLVEVPGDVEGFGMVAVEAASYGVPTVAFDVGGVRDALPSDEYLIPPGRYTEFMYAVDTIARSDRDDIELIEWAEGFSMAAFRPKLLHVLSRSESLSATES